ncbi:response regulator [Hydrogenophaga sp.]|uniref:response regulator n=1 Tax=Hydrogenophaga sp. TaxID=1904254 RepID=UPI00260D78E2|nr:response regulator [Hydrogenophaga sp.]MCW5655213.1 response regulator [Hydrogenophaga sp.]
MATILVVDDELGIRDLLSEILNDEGHTVELAENAAQARAVRSQLRPDLVLLDIWMPDTDGVTLLKEWASTGLLSMPVIMMSGHATIDTAVEATRIGAAAFLEKPITMQKLLKAVDQGLHKTPAKPANGGGSGHGGGNGSFVPGLRAGGVTGFGGNGSMGLHPGVGAGSGGLELTVESVMTGGTALHETTLDLGPQSSQSFNLDGPLREARDEFEKAYFEYHLAKEAGSMTRVAEKTGLERTHLYRKLKQLGVDLARSKRNAL